MGSRPDHGLPAVIATTQVTLPDNLTTWRLNAAAISKDTYVGDASLDVVSTKPLLVRPLNAALLRRRRSNRIGSRRQQ